MADTWDVVACAQTGAPMLLVDPGYVHLRDTRNRKQGMWFPAGDGRSNGIFIGELTDGEQALIARIALCGTGFLSKQTSFSDPVLPEGWSLLGDLTK